MEKSSWNVCRHEAQEECGEVIAISEDYVAKASALNGIEPVRKNAAGVTTGDETETKLPPCRCPV